MSRWKRLSVRDFHFRKVSKVFMYRGGPNAGRPISEHSIYCGIWGDITLYTNGEGLYRLYKNGELLCEGDELLLACAVVGVENAHYRDEWNEACRAFVVDGDLS